MSIQLQDEAGDVTAIVDQQMAFCGSDLPLGRVSKSLGDRCWLDFAEYTLWC